MCLLAACEIDVLIPIAKMPSRLVYRQMETFFRAGVEANTTNYQYQH